MKKRGVSAAVAALIAMTFLVLGIYMSVLVTYRTGRGGEAQLAGIHKAVGEEHVGLRIFIKPADGDAARIEFINELGDTIRIDYIVVLDKAGNVKIRLEGDQVPAPLKAIPPGLRVTLKPSELGLGSAYDNDYWKMKREILRIMVHSADGNVFSSIYGRPPGEVAPVYIGTTMTTTTTTTVATTTTTTSTTAIATTTITRTTYI